MPGRRYAAIGCRRDLPRRARRDRQGAVRMSTVVEVFPDSKALVGTAGDRLIGAIQTAVAARGRALLVLTGGGNGIALLQHLGAHGQQIDWSKVHLFWGDDRYVPEDDDERN